MAESEEETKPGSPAKDKPRLLRNVFSNWSSFLFTAVVAFFLSPFVVRSLGDSAYGAWVLLGSLVGYMGLLDFGVRGAVTRYIAKFYAEEDHHKASRLATSALIIFLLSGLIAILLAIVLAVAVVPAFQIPPDLISKARIVVVLGGATIATTLINGVFEGIIVGRQRFDYTSGITVVAEGLRAIIVVLVLSAGHGLVALAIVQLVISLLRVLAAYIVGHKLYPELRIAFQNWDPETFRLILSFSIYTTLLAASGRIINFTDSLVIGAYLPVSLLTFYAIASNLTIYARSIISGVTFTFTPLTSALQAKGERLELQRIVLKGARFSTLVILPIIATFLLRGDSFIGLWMGPQYGRPSGAVLQVLSLALWAQGGFGVVVSTMFGLNRHKGLVPFFLVEAVVNLGLSIWLVQRVGIIGVAWGTAAPRLVVSLLGGPWYLRRTLGVGIPIFWLNAWIRPTVSMLPFAIGSFAIEELWPATSLTGFFLQVAAALPLAALGAWALCLTSAERASYRAVLIRQLHRALGRA
jgi:O-antigen/teichoic acid export membrane protein